MVTKRPDASGVRAVGSQRAGAPSALERFAYDPADDDETRRQKKAIVVVAGGCTVAGVVWTAMYWAIFGWGFTASLPLSFVVIVGSALAASHRSRNHIYAVYAQIVCIMYVTVLIQASIGGVFASGFVYVWAFIGPITALAFFPFRRAAIWFVLYMVNLAVALALDDRFRAHGLPVDEGTRTLFFAMNVGASAVVVFFFASHFAQTAEAQRARAEQLEDSLEEEKAKQLGPYTLEGKLGAGGMGVVYKARHALLRRPTAVKMLPVDKVGEDNLRRFEREVQLTATLSHPNTVAIHDYGRSADGVFYYAMEFLDGVDLETLVRRAGPLPPERVVHILQQVCGALEEAHHRGLVHRDIKPANIMVCRLGNRTDVAKVLDFGLVKELATDDKVTHENTIAGTPAYIAPESVNNPTKVGPPADLYAVGAVAHWLLTARTVFSGSSVVEVFAHHLHTDPEPLSRHAAGIPDALEKIVMACLAKQPAGRPASAKVLGRLLGEVPLANPWTDEAAHAWWDVFDASSEHRANVPVTGTEKTLQVDVRGRGEAARLLTTVR